MLQFVTQISLYNVSFIQYQMSKSIEQKMKYMVILEDKFLKKIEEIKENISKINDPLEMVRFLDEIQINTAKWCKQNCPEEVIFENGTEIEITISGRMQFLNSIQ